MADFWLFFVKKSINQHKQIIKYISILFNNILKSSKYVSKDSLTKIEIQKLKWELGFYHKKLGKYIYNCNKRWCK